MQSNPVFSEKRFVYGRIVRMFHWVVGFCFIILAVLAFSRHFFDDPVLNGHLIAYHRSFGMFTFCLVGLRLFWRLFTGEFLSTVNSPMIRIVASVTHAIIYVLLIIIPILGWMEASARQNPVSVFGQDLPMPISFNLQLAENLQIWHKHFGDWFCIIIALHVSAVIWRHFLRQDGVLYSMLPLCWLRKPWSGGADYAVAKIRYENHK